MNVATYAAFKDELTKIAWHSGAEIAGLGMLAAPTIQKMRGKPMSQKATNAAEVGGLGVLAVPAAHSIYKAVKKGGMAAIKHASVEKTALAIKKAGIFGGMAGMRSAAIDAAHMAKKGLQGKGIASQAVKMAPQAPRAIPSASQIGGHAFKRPTTGKFAPIEIPGLT